MLSSLSQLRIERVASAMLEIASQTGDTGITTFDRDGKPENEQKQQ